MKPSRLASIKSGQIRRPPRCLFYGSEGVGKTTLAADAPNPVILDIEGGSDRVDVARYPLDATLTLDSVRAAVDDLITNVHPYRTVILDTVDALESLLWRHVCVEHKQDSIEAFGYGKGYQVALDAWRELLAQLDGLRDRAITVVLLGHAVVRTFKNPLGDDFDRYQLRVHDKAAGLLKEWCDVVGFVRFDEGAGKLRDARPGDKRARGWATGRRLVHLERGPAWDAKSRLTLPAELELGAAHPWAPFGAAIDASESDAGPLIEVELARLGERFTVGDEERTAADVRAAAAKANPAALARVLSALRTATPTVKEAP